MGYVRRLLFLLPLFAVLTAPAQVPIVYTHITLNSMLGVTAGNTAQLCATPADQYGNPISFSSNGVGFVKKGALFCGSVVNGALTASLGVPNACVTNNANAIFYNFTIQELDGGGDPSGPPVVINAVPNVCGAAYALDTYAPVAATSTPLSPPLAQGVGVPSICTAPAVWLRTDVPSLYYCQNGVFAAINTQGPAGPSGAGVSVFNATGAYTVAASSNPALVRCTGAFSLTLPASPATGEIVYVKNVGTGTITVSGNGVPIDGQSTFSLASGAAYGAQPAITLAFDAATLTWSVL